MKTEGFGFGPNWEKSFDSMTETAEIWATDCPLASMQFEQHAARKAMHPMSILAKAYDKSGFSKSVEDLEERENSDV